MSTLWIIERSSTEITVQRSLFCYCQKNVDDLSAFLNNAIYSLLNSWQMFHSLLNVWMDVLAALLPCELWINTERKYKMSWQSIQMSHCRRMDVRLKCHPHGGIVDCKYKWLLGFEAENHSLGKHQRNEVLWSGSRDSPHNFMAINLFHWLTFLLKVLMVHFSYSYNCCCHSCLLVDGFMKSTSCCFWCLCSPSVLMACQRNQYEINE